MMSMEIFSGMVLAIGLKLLYGIAVLFIGLKLIQYVNKLVNTAFKKSNLDKSVRTFLESLVSIGLKVLLVIIVAGIVGIKTTTFAALFGAAGVAIGLALQGSLSNLAGGVLILILKPFVVDDFIETSGYMGTVNAISIFYTYLTTVDNKQVVIPNGQLSNGSLINYSSNKLRRVDLVFGVGYESSTEQVKSILRSIMDNHELILNEPEPFVRMSAQADSAIEFTVRAWCKSSDYWNVYFDLMEQSKEEFDKANINIPYPHMDVNVIK